MKFLQDKKGASNTYASNTLWLLCLSALIGSFPKAEAGQLGPSFPTHRYPTDVSFHMGYGFRIINSSSNFTQRLIIDPLLNDAKLRIVRHEFLPEFQPNRQLSLGARIVVDQLSMSRPGVKTQTRSTLGDQTIFAEYRILDEPGSSLGMATVVKFPSYGNPTLAELQRTATPERTLLPGDAQTDASFLITTEFWAGKNLRFRADAGYMTRLDGYSPELPFNLSLGVVNPKMDLEVRLKGNFTLGGGEANNEEALAIRKAFAYSDYAYSPDPWVVVIEPHIELWLSAKSAVTLSYSHSLMGTRAAAYHALGAGFIYRWAETRNRPRKTFKDVPIGTDLESGKFEGEKPSEEESQYLDTDPVFEN